MSEWVPIIKVVRSEEITRGEKTTENDAPVTSSRVVSTEVYFTEQVKDFAALCASKHFGVELSGIANVEGKVGDVMKDIMNPEGDNPMGNMIGNLLKQFTGGSADVPSCDEESEDVTDALESLGDGLVFPTKVEVPEVNKPKKMISTEELQVILEDRFPKERVHELMPEIIKDGNFNLDCILNELGDVFDKDNTDMMKQITNCVKIKCDGEEKVTGLNININTAEINELAEKCTCDDPEVPTPV